MDARNVGIGAALEQRHRNIEVPVDRRRKERCRLVGEALLVDVGATVQQCDHCRVIALASSSLSVKFSDP